MCVVLGHNAQSLASGWLRVARHSKPPYGKKEDELGFGFGGQLIEPKKKTTFPFCSLFC